MSLKRYENEIAVGLLLLFAFGAFLFRSYRHDVVAERIAVERKKLHTLEETMVLKRTWGDRDRIKSALTSLHAFMTNKRADWRQNGTKIDAVYENLSGGELNRLLGKWFSSPLRIETLSTSKEAKGYRVEVSGKW